MAVVAKFGVTSVERQGYSGPDGSPHTSGVKVNLQAVYVDPKNRSPADENTQFWEATPSGQLWMQINNPGAFGFFKEGEQVYLTFTKEPPI